VQVGLPSGRFRIQYSKAGFASGLQEVTIDAGGLNEVPSVTLKAVATAAQAAVPQDAAAGEGQTKQVVEAFAKAQEALRAGQVDEAEALYREVLARPLMWPRPTSTSASSISGRRTMPRLRPTSSG